MSNIAHFVFVDFENRPIEDLGALAPHSVVVVLFLGQKSRLKPALVTQIESLPFEVRVIKVGVTKKNAADFVLTYHLGATMALFPTGHFYIVSGDDDYDSVITHLGTNGSLVSRHDEIASLPFLTGKPAEVAVKKKVPRAESLQSIAAEDSVSAKIINLLSDSVSNSRPTSRKKLVSYVKNLLGLETPTPKAEALVKRLEATKQLFMVNLKGKITYLTSAPPTSTE